MRFLHPLLLAWGLLALVPLILYLFRRRPRRERVSTLIFFKALALEHRESAWLRRLKRLLSLLLTLLVLLLGAAALARPVVAPPAGALRGVVLLVDRSASMAARGSDGRTRLAAALTELRARLAGLPEDVPVALLAYDARPELLLPRSRDRRELERALARLSVRPIAGRPEEALRLAARLAALETPASIWHATDAGPLAWTASPTPAAASPAASLLPASPAASAVPAASVPPSAAPEPPEDLPEATAALPPLRLPPGVRLETLEVALAEPVNVGITAFQLRPAPLEGAVFEGFIELAACARASPAATAAPLAATLEVRLDGTLIEPRALALVPGERSRLIIRIAADPQRERRLELRLAAPGDVLALDDRLLARVPAVRPIRVLWLSPQPDPFLELAFASLGEHGALEVFQADAAAWPPKEPVDLIVFDGWLPESWPEGTPAAPGPAVVVINPPGALGPVRAVRLAGEGLPVEAPRTTRPQHPLLYGLRTDRLTLLQTAVLEADGALEPLWVGPSGPLLAAGEVRGQRVAVLAFAPARSGYLPLQAAFPVLMGNLLCWAVAPQTAARTGNNHRTGELLALEGHSLVWPALAADGGARAATVPLRGRLVELDRQGLWETDAGASGSAALCSAAETLLRAAPTAPPAQASSLKPQASAAGFFRGELTGGGLWLILLVLALESWLFHRLAVY